MRKKERKKPTLAVCVVAGFITLLLIGVRGLKVLNLGVVRYLHFLIRIIRELDLGPVDVCPDGTEFDTVSWEAHTGWTAGWDACWSKEVSREDRSWVLTSFAIKVTQRCWSSGLAGGLQNADADAGQVKGISARGVACVLWGSSLGRRVSRLGGARSRGCAVVAHRRGDQMAT